MARLRNRLNLAAVGTLILVAGVISASAATAQVDTETLSVSISVDPSGTELVAWIDLLTLTAEVTNAPAGITPTYRWEWRYSGDTEWLYAGPPDEQVMRWRQGSPVTITTEFRVTVIYGSDTEATSEHVSVTWTGTPAPDIPWPGEPTTTTTLPCTVTTTVAKPTGLTATVNPESYNFDGILLTWDAVAASDEVEFYRIYRREVIEGTATSPTRLFSLNVQGVSWSGTQWAIDVANDPVTGTLTSGTTYAYAVEARRTDNCLNAQSSDLSDEVTVTFTASAEGMSGDEEDDEFVGGL